MLSGKYNGGTKTPIASRKLASPELGGRITERVWPAIDAYFDLARRYGLDPIHMALSWAMNRPFMGSVIFGATSQDQLEHILSGAELKLSDELLKEIDVVHKSHPMPF